MAEKNATTPTAKNLLAMSPPKTEETYCEHRSAAGRHPQFPSLRHQYCAPRELMWSPIAIKMVSVLVRRDRTVFAGIRWRAGSRGDVVWAEGDWPCPRSSGPLRLSGAPYSFPPGRYSVSLQPGNLCLVPADCSFAWWEKLSEPAAQRRACAPRTHGRLSPDS